MSPIPAPTQDLEDYQQYRQQVLDAATYDTADALSWKVAEHTPLPSEAAAFNASFTNSLRYAARDAVLDSWLETHRPDLGTDRAAYGVSYMGSGVFLNTYPRNAASDDDGRMVARIHDDGTIEVLTENLRKHTAPADPTPFTNPR